MTLQTSGSISLNEIHVEAGGTSGTQASINDADIRGIAASIPSGHSPMPFSFWYGAPFSVGSWPTGAGSITEPFFGPIIGYDSNSDGTGSAYMRVEFKQDTTNNRIEFRKGTVRDGTVTYAYAYLTYSGDVLDQSNSTNQFQVAVDWTTSNTSGNGTVNYTEPTSTRNYNSGSDTPWEQISTSYGTPWEWGVSSTGTTSSETEVTATFYIRVKKGDVYFPFATGYTNSGSKTYSIQASANSEPVIEPFCLHYDMQVELLNGNLINVNFVKVGDMIKTRKGYTRVSEVITEHMREGYFIVDNSLKITDDHPIQVNGKWVTPVDYIGMKQYITGKVPTVYIGTESGDYLTFANGKTWNVSGDYKDAYNKN